MGKEVFDRTSVARRVESACASRNHLLRVEITSFVASHASVGGGARPRETVGPELDAQVREGPSSHFDVRGSMLDVRCSAVQKDEHRTLNIEHRTSNERQRIPSSPAPPRGWDVRCSAVQKDESPPSSHFDVRCSMLDVRCSAFRTHEDRTLNIELRTSNEIHRITSSPTPPRGVLPTAAPPRRALAQVARPPPPDARPAPPARASRRRRSRRPPPRA